MKHKYKPPATGGFKILGAKTEQKITNLSLKYPTLKKALSFIFMPIAFKTGLKINNEIDNFYAEIPSKKFNKNAYGTMAGASILANLELAGGSYLLVKSNSKYRLVCKNVNYNFRLPSSQSLHFKFESLDDNLDEMIAQNKPFNANLKATVFRTKKKSNQIDKQIGRGTICFHLWPIPNN